MYWNADFNYDEVYDEGEGIVTFLTCKVCGAEAEFSYKEEDEDEEEELSDNYK